MDVTAKLARLERKRTFLTAFGGLGTFGYLCLLFLLTDWSELLGMAPNNVGDFLAGAFAPLAFMWLVVGYFLQALELKQNSESLMQQAWEMKQAVEQAAKQAESVVATEAYSRVNTINQTRIQFENDLAKHSSFVYKAIFKTSGSSEVWAKFDQGDREIFVQRIIEKLNTENHINFVIEGIKGNRRQASVLNSYVICYSLFIVTLEQLDVDPSLLELYENSNFGELNKLLIQALSRAKNAKVEG